MVCLAMTQSSEAPSKVPPSDEPLGVSRHEGHRRGRSAAIRFFQSGCVLLATVIGCQALSASASSRSTVVAITHGDGGGASADFMSGFALGLDQVRACGVDPASVDWVSIAPGDDPSAFLGQQVSVLVAPFSADLATYAQLASQRKLGVLLPYQRGDSIESLSELDPEGRLHPVVPPYQQDLNHLVDDLRDQGIQRVMVVADPTDRSADQAERFVSAFQAKGGIVESYEPSLVQMLNPGDTAALERLVNDVSWKGPQAMVVAAAHDSALAQQLDQAQASGRFGQSPEVLLRVWLLPHHRVQDLSARSWPQLILNQPAHGPGWTDFSSLYSRVRGEQPTLLAASGFDTARLMALSALTPPPISTEGTRDPLGWLAPDQESKPLCDAIGDRLSGKPVRLIGAASDLMQRPGQPPSGQATTRRIPSR